MLRACANKKHRRFRFAAPSSTMARWVIAVCLSSVWITQQLAVCDWTFSLRVTSARCCTSDECEEVVDSCQGLSIGLCLRSPGTPLANRENCPTYFEGRGIFDRELTPDDDRNTAGGNTGDIITTAYEGGIQIYAGVADQDLNIPPFNDGIDEMYIMAENTPDGGEVSLAGFGVSMRANLTISLIVECSPGYGGDDCLTLNTCSDQITCNQILGYCTSAGECVCYDGTTRCASTPSETSGPDPGPIIAGVVVTVVVLIIIIIAVVFIIVLYYKRSENRKPEEIVLRTVPLDNTSQVSTLDPPPLYSTINKEKKRRRTPPEIPAPYQVPVADQINTDTAGVTSQPNNQGAESHGENGPTNGTIVRDSRGIVYADLDLPKTAPPKPPRSPETSSSSSPRSSTTNTPLGKEEPVTYSFVNPYSKPRTPPQPGRPGEVAYYSVVVDTKN